MYISKDELLKTILTKTGIYCREAYFKKMFPENYLEIQSLNFPIQFTFNQKLYHYIFDVNMKHGICKICGKPTRFKGFGQGYSIYCSSDCLKKDDEFKQKISNIWQSWTEQEKEDINNKKHIWWESLSKSKKDNITNKRKVSWSKKSKDEVNKMTSKIKNTWNNKSQQELKEIRNKKIKSINLKSEKEKQQILQKRYSTKRKNNTFNISSLEKLFENYLQSKKYEYIRQYRDKVRYPFLCDFYLPQYDMFIEIQGNWTHGKHPFNKLNKEDMEIVHIWESKNSRYYKKAINDWTQRDPLKRETAKNNNLNYLEIFSDDIEIVIKTFEEYLLKIKG